MSKEKVEKIDCYNCNCKTNHILLFECKEDYREEQEISSQYTNVDVFYAGRTIEVLRCQGCNCITIRDTWWDSETIDEIGQAIDRVSFYPPRGKSNLRVKIFRNTPSTLDEIYRETVNCFNNGNYILCAGGIRAIVEGICKDKKVDKGPVDLTDENGKPCSEMTESLKGRINGMVKKEFLTKEHAETLHELQFIGDKALHELKMPSIDELKSAIEVIEHTFENQYELSRKKEILKRRKIKK